MTVKVVMDHGGMESLLRSAGIQSELQSVANSVKGTQSGNYKVEIQQQKSRAVARISAADGKTYRKNLKTNALAKMVK